MSYPVFKASIPIPVGTKITHPIDNRAYKFVTVDVIYKSGSCRRCAFDSNKVDARLCAIAPRCWNKGVYGIFLPIYRNGEHL